MSSDAEQEFFSDGITEEILNSLASEKSLKVAGRTSSFAFKGQNDDLRRIGEALGVAHILEGSVRKAGAQVRITAQLIHAATDRLLWAESYERDFQDLLLVQSAVARAIADEIHDQFKQRKASRFSLEGYEEARWILMDYGGVVIHLFDEKTRDFYALEMLWGDAPQLSWAVRAGVDKRS